MCGIFGWIKFNDSFSDQEIILARKALITLKHRGPDYQGDWTGENVFMGHCRLSIIDLNKEANQPFIENSGNLVLSYNGEIYNYLELKDELRKMGLNFRTVSDTEVLIKSFLLWNLSCFQRFDGMFAGAIQDCNKGRHYLFRDPLGQKPLYYYFYKDGLIYSSELRAILSIDKFDWKLDRDNFLKYLLNCYYILETTPIIGIKKLLPGCFMEIDIRTGDYKINSYWESVPGEKTLDISFSEAGERFSELLDRSCEISMRSDVPVGVFLSGGIDSSLVMKSCRKYNPDIASFVVSMSEKDFDESEKAEKISDFLKISNKNKYVLDSFLIKNSLDEFFSFSDEPHGDPGFVNTFYLTKKCSSAIKVALSGDGADELFGGYLPFMVLRGEKIFGMMPKNIIEMLNYLSINILPCSDRYVDLKFRFLSFFQGFYGSEIARFPYWLSSLPSDMLGKLCPWKDKDYFNGTGEKGTIFEDFHDLMYYVKGKTRIQQLLYFYQKVFLPEFVCLHTDRAAMQNSLEVRSPFMSCNIIDFANRLPDNFKVYKGEMKKILRYTLKRDGIPSSIYRQKKHGFTFPVARWLKTSIKPIMENLLSENMWDSSFIDISYMNFLMNQHLSNRRNNYRILYNLMVFRKWLDKFPFVKI